MTGKNAADTDIAGQSPVGSGVSGAPGASSSRLAGLRSLMGAAWRRAKAAFEGSTDDPGTAAPPQKGAGAVPVESRGAIMGGMLVMLITFGGFGGWAAFAPLSSAVVATGTVKVLSERKTVQHPEGGVVKDIRVRNGERVNAGDVLVRLDDTEANANAQILRAQLDAAEAAMARLRAEQVRAGDMPLSARLEARMDIPAVRETVDSQHLLFKARRATLIGQQNILNERIAQLEEEIKGLEALVTSENEQIAMITTELSDMRELLRRELASRNRVSELEREKSRLNGSRADHRARIAQARRQITEAELQILQSSEEFHQQVVEELRETQTEYFDLAERLAAAEHSLDLMDIRATEDGVVVGRQVATVGQVITPGQTLLEIVPDGDALVVEARVRPQDVDEVREGLEAGVQFSAFSSRDIQRLTGEVSYVSADSLVDERTGEAFFTARITVPDPELARLGEEARLQPGMPAEVFIKTGERTALAYLIKPIADSVRRAWKES